MIVQPDFFEHWKTKQLTVDLGTDAAPLFVLRLWAHCQSRRKWRFENLTDAGLAGVCGFRGEPTGLRRALIETRFIVMDGNTTVVHDFENVNASLIASWTNGSKGGRHHKNNPRVSHGPPHRQPGSSYLISTGTEEKKGRAAHGFSDQPKADPKKLAGFGEGLTALAAKMRNKE